MVSHLPWYRLSLELALQLVSPLPLGLESTSGTVLWQKRALSEKAPSHSTAPWLLVFFMLAAVSRLLPLCL